MAGDPISRINFHRKLDLAAHFMVAVFFSVLIYSKFQRVSYIAVFLLGSILIDLDHFIDYFLFFKHRFRFSDFFGCTYLNSGRVYVIFHSWEINALVLITGLISGSGLLLMLSFGLFVHLAVDTLFRKNKLYCFLLYRKNKKFDLKVLLPELYPYYKNTNAGNNDNPPG